MVHYLTIIFDSIYICDYMQLYAYSIIHIYILIQELCFNFFLAYLVVFCSILDSSCGTLGEIICTAKPDTRENCSQQKSINLEQRQQK